MCPTPPPKSWWDDVLSWLGWYTAHIPLPQNDPFYSAEVTTIQSLAPGTIVRFRAVQITPFPFFDADKLKAWQICYRTTGQLGDPQVTVTTVMKPPNASGNKVISYQSKTDSASPSCKTSFALHKGNSYKFGGKL